MTDENVNSVEAANSAATNDQALPGTLDSVTSEVADPPQAINQILETVEISFAEHANYRRVSPKSLSWVIDQIRTSPILKQYVEKIRAEAEPEKHRKLKEDLLPYFMFMSYRDGIRDIAHFERTSFMLIDVDHIGNRMIELKDRFRSDPRIFMFFVSPGGEGLKVVFALNGYITNSERYTDAYDYLQDLLKREYTLESDYSTVDSARCCFLSYDPDLYVNSNATLLDIPKGWKKRSYNLAEQGRGDEKLLSLLKGVKAGGAGQPGRHTALVTLASFYKSKNMDQTMTIAALKAWNHQNDPPLDEAELTKQVEYVFRKANYGNRRNIQTGETEVPKVRRLWTGAEMKLEAETSPMKELLEGVLADEGVYMLAGQDKAGKSLLGMNLALSVAGEKEKFLTWKIMKHGPVVYFNNELSVKQMGRRLLQMDPPAKVDRKYEVHYMNDKDLRFDENIEEILDFCRQYSPVLVVVDCHYRTTVQDKDYGNAIQTVLENYTRIKEEMRCCVFVIHHTRKAAVGQRADSSQAMGSHTFAMMTDGNLQLKKSDTEPDKRVLFETGSRDFSGFRPRLLKLNELSLWFGDLGECSEEDHVQEINKVRKNIAEYPVKILEETPGNQVMKDNLLSQMQIKYNISQATAYRAFDKASGSGRIAVSAGSVVTLVKEGILEQPSPGPVTVPQEELPEAELEEGWENARDGHSHSEN